MGISCRLCRDVLVFLVFSAVVKQFNVWSFLLEFPAQCERSDIPSNSSGLKVLVAGFGKSGTRGVSHALNAIGIRAYHSEDLYLFSYRRYVFRMRGKSGKPWWQVKPLDLAKALQTDPGAVSEFSASISKCRAEAATLDGFERMFWPLYTMNSSTKVILLDWRTFKQYQRSLQAYLPKFFAMVAFNTLTGSSTNVLPWGALLRVLDPLVGRPIGNALRAGGPPTHEVSGPMMSLYHSMIQHRRHTHYVGSTIIPGTEAEYSGFFDEVRRAVPPERLMTWDPRTHTYADLCSFMGVSPCPRQGAMPKSVNTWTFERNFRAASGVCLAVRLFLHWVNWKIFGLLLQHSGQLLRSCCCKRRLD